jgi:DNA-binding MarR family transcriptional regulator
MKDTRTPCPYRKLLELTRSIGHVYESSFADAGLTATQHRLLSEIKRLRAARSVDLSRAICLDPSTLSRNLKPLLAKGWVRIEEGDDARSHRVVLTESGLQRHALGQRQWRIAKAKVLQALGLQRVVRLYGLAEECGSVLALSQPASGSRLRKT